MAQLEKTLKINAQGMKRNISLTKGKSIFIVDLILIPVFVFVIYSGLQLHIAGHINHHNIWEYWAHYHVITSVLSLIFGGLHIKSHWRWYKSLIRNGRGKKNQITVALSLLFLIEIITGIILVLFIEGGSSSVGIWHYRLGIVMIVSILIHVVTRFSLMMKGLRYRNTKSHLDH